MVKTTQPKGQGTKRKNPSSVSASKKSKYGNDAPVMASGSALDDRSSHRTSVMTEEDNASLDDAIVIEVDQDGNEKLASSRSDSEPENSDVELGEGVLFQTKRSTLMDTSSQTPERMVLTNLWLLQAQPTY